MIALWIGMVSVFVLYIVLCNRHQDGAAYDNIVVLTGGPNRITRAFQLIESCRPKNIFISGVYQKTMLSDISPTGKNQNIKIFLGKQATNTQENALEINEWVKRYNIAEILLITSDYHIPRSAMELRNINSSLQIHPYGVKSSISFGFMRLCIKELHKIIYIYIRNFVKS